MIIYTVKVNDNGDKHWYLDGKLHRIDGPAAEYADGTKHWYLDDKLHRVDGPALEYADGSKEWWRDNKCHRIDGPAIEWADGSKSWYVDGKELTHSQWIEAVKPKPSCVGKIVEVDGVKYKLVAA
jgi:hypothetical protein